MKAFLVFLVLAIVAMAAAQRGSPVNFVDNAEPVHVVNNNPSPVQFVDNNPTGSPVQFVDNNPTGSAVNVVNNSPSGQLRPIIPPRPGQGNIIQNPDSFYNQGGRPSRPNGGYEPISVGPTFVNNYPPKQYNNQFARGGK